MALIQLLENFPERNEKFAIMGSGNQSSFQCNQQKLISVYLKEINDKLFAHITEVRGKSM